MEAAVEFMNTALSGGGSVLVHCAAGVSRSSTVVAAWLLANNLAPSPAEAIEVMRAARPIVSPNESFAEQLECFHRMGCRVDPTSDVFLDYTTRLGALRERIAKESSFTPQQSVNYILEKQAADAAKDMGHHHDDDDIPKGKLLHEL
jgi:hypothetical protein